MDKGATKTKMHHCVSHHCEQTLNKLKQMWEGEKQTSKQQKMVRGNKK